jgi:iron complex transport system ATP-binding protein
MRAFELRDVWAGYGRAVVLNNLTWSVEEGEFWAVVGPNGSGKTTLLRTLIKAVLPTMGSIRLFDRPLQELGQREIARTLACIQQSELHPVNISVLQYALLGRYPHLRALQTPGSRDLDIARSALTTTGAGEFTDQSLFSLSSGQFQMAMIARALAQEPKALAIDEPTAHLDLDHAFQVMELLRELHRKGMTVIVVLHDLNLAMRYAEKTLVLWDGTPRAQGETRRIIDAQLVREVFHVESKDIGNGHLRFEPME